MRKWLIIFYLMALPVFAQEISDNTFNPNNPSLIRDQEPYTFKGGSLVYIQGISDKPQPKSWMDNIKLRLFGSMEIPDRPDAPHLTEISSFPDTSEQTTGIPTKDFFGLSKQLRYTPHTSDWDFIIQPMDNNTISIQENIQLLLTEEKHIMRSWPIPKEQFALIKAQIGNRFIQSDKTSKEVRLDFDVLPAGLHKITLHYTLLLPVQKNLILSLIDARWPLITDAFSGVILNGNISFQNPRFLLGQNQQEIPENFLFQEDNQGNIFFKNTHILPAFTQIQLNAQTADNAPQNSKIGIFFSSEILIFTVSFIIILLYLISSGLEIHFASLTYLLKRFKYIPNRFKSYLYRMGEIITGCFMLLFFTFLTASLFDVQIKYFYWCFLIVSTIIGILSLDVFVFYPTQKMIYQLRQNKEKK